MRIILERLILQGILLAILTALILFVAGVWP